MVWLPVVPMFKTAGMLSYDGLLKACSSNLTEFDTSKQLKYPGVEIIVGALSCCQATWND
jgi:hypothetical protein